MKDFDTERNQRLTGDRSFRLAGREFRYRPSVAPEVILGWSQFAEGADPYERKLKLAAARLNVTRATKSSDELIAKGELEVVEAENALAEARPTDSQWIEALDRTATAVLEAGYAEAWRDARSADVENPLSLADLQEVLEWLIEQVSGRPTGQPSGSDSSPNGSGTSSTDGSSSTADLVLVPSTTPSS